MQRLGEPPGPWFGQVPNHFASFKLVQCWSVFVVHAPRCSLAGVPPAVAAGSASMAASAKLAMPGNSGNAKVRIRWDNDATSIVDGALKQARVLLWLRACMRARVCARACGTVAGQRLLKLRLSLLSSFFFFLPGAL